MKIAAVLLVMLVTGIAAPRSIAQTRQKADSVLVCESRSAYAYHRYKCRGLARCTHTIVKLSKADAVKQGYKPCKICY